MKANSVSVKIIQKSNRKKKKRTISYFTLSKLTNMSSSKTPPRRELAGALPHWARGTECRGHKSCTLRCKPLPAPTACFLPSIWVIRVPGCGWARNPGPPRTCGQVLFVSGPRRGGRG